MLQLCKLGEVDSNDCQTINVRTGTQNRSFVIKCSKYEGFVGLDCKKLRTEIEVYIYFMSDT